jgi:uncharacterized membrane protein YtjA (UPF0391 family)
MVSSTQVARMKPVNGQSTNKTGKKETHIMLHWTIVFLVLALIAAVLGFGGIAGAAAGIAQILFFVFLALLIISAIARAFKGRTP